VPRPSGQSNESSATSILILVGMRGSGKTTVGRQLASSLDVRFIDTDGLVEQRGEKSIATIFRDQGEASFRALERAVVASLTEHDEALIVATGGGVVLEEDNRRDLARLGTVVFLDAPPRVLAQRIHGSGRPSLLKLEPSDEVELLATYRRPLYMEIADFVLDATQPVERIVAQLTALWQNRHHNGASHRTQQPQ